MCKLHSGSGSDICFTHPLIGQLNSMFTYSDWSLKRVSCDAWGLLITHIFHIMVSYSCYSSDHTLQANKDFWKECGGAIKYVCTLVCCFVFHPIKSNS